MSCDPDINMLTEAVAASPDDVEPLFRCISAMRSAHMLDAVDATYAAAPAEIQRNADIISVWAAVPRIRMDWPETLRRARLMLELHPDHCKPHHHLIYAINGAAGYDAARLYARWAMDRFGDIPTFTAPAVEIACHAADWPAVIDNLLKLRAAGEDSAWTRRMWIIALGKLGLDDERRAAVDKAKADFPDDVDIRSI